MLRSTWFSFSLLMESARFGGGVSGRFLVEAALRVQPRGGRRFFAFRFADVCFFARRQPLRNKSVGQVLDFNSSSGTRPALERGEEVEELFLVPLVCLREV